MQQLDCFAPMTDTPRARRSDPETSHIAADRIKASGVLGKQQAAVLEAVRRYPGSTAVEIAKLAGIDRYAVSRRRPAQGTWFPVKRVCV